MGRYFKLYKVCIGTAFSRALAYRANFLMSMLITLSGNIIFPLITVIIYSSGASFEGWSFYEVLLLQAIFTVAEGISSILFGGVLWVTMSHIREGTYEIILLKPLSPLFFLIATTFNPESFGLIIGGVVLMIYSLSQIATVTAAAFMMFLLLFCSGMAVMAGISLIMAATSFKWVGNSRIPEIFDSIKMFGKYPITIFPSIIQSIVGFVLPVGMIAFYPAEVLLGRFELSRLLLIIPCVLFLIFGVYMYRHMLKQYEGVGG